MWKSILLLLLLVHCSEQEKSSVGWMTRLSKRESALPWTRCFLDLNGQKFGRADHGMQMQIRSSTELATVEAWVRFDDSTLADDNSPHALIAQQGAVSFGFVGNAVAARLHSSSAGWQLLEDGNKRSIEVPVNGTWTHIMWTLSPTGNDLNLPISERAHAKVFVDIDGFDRGHVVLTTNATELYTPPPLTRSNMTLFGEVDGSDRFKGGVSELRIWRKELMPLTEVSLMRQPIDGTRYTALAAYWRFNECQGAVLTDRGLDNQWSANTVVLVDDEDNNDFDNENDDALWSFDELPPVCLYSCAFRGACLNASCSCSAPFDGEYCGVLLLNGTDEYTAPVDLVVDELTVSPLATLSLSGILHVTGDVHLEGQVIAPVLGELSMFSISVDGDLHLGSESGALISGADSVHGKAAKTTLRIASHGGLSSAWDKGHEAQFCGDLAFSNCTNSVYGSWEKPTYPGTPAKQPPLTYSAPATLLIQVGRRLILHSQWSVKSVGKGGASAGAIWMVLGGLEMPDSSSPEHLLSGLSVRGSAEGSGAGRMRIELATSAPLPADLVDRIFADSLQPALTSSPGTVYLPSGVVGHCPPLEASDTDCSTLIVAQHLPHADSVPQLATPIFATQTERSALYRLVVRSAMVNFTSPMRFHLCELSGAGTALMGLVSCNVTLNVTMSAASSASLSGTSNSSSSAHLSTLWIVVISVLCALALLAIVAGSVLLRRRRNNSRGRKLRSLDSLSLLSSTDFDSSSLRVHLPADSDELAAVRERVGQHLIDIGDVVLSSQSVAKGAFAAVYQGDYLGQQVAVKLMVADIDDVPIDVFYREVEALVSLRHRNIVPFVGALLQPIGVVTAWAVHGSLQHAMRDKPEFYEQWPLKLSTMLDVAKGMDYLHSREPALMHRDLKVCKTKTKD
jgi:Protein tyrosine and serine/threonine kinase/Concanavalin A-like lectin/glucanases superfamily